MTAAPRTKGSGPAGRTAASRRVTDLRRITAMLEIPRGRLVAAIVSASVTLGAAFALAAVSGWLITTAWTRPPVLDLTVAVVAVRALGITRGVFRWIDRMATHDAAFTGVVHLRTNLFTALASGRGDALARLRRGDLLARLGDDAQEIGDHVIRAVVPIAVAVVMALAALAVIAPISPLAALAMIAGLLIASVGAPLASYRAALLTQEALIARRGEVTGTALQVLDDATALRLSGRLESALDDLRDAQGRADAALDRAAVPAALAAAAVPAGVLVALLGSVLAAGPLWTSGSASAGAIGVLVLLPLSAFEASAALPAAAAQVARSRAAAARLVATIGPDATARSADGEPSDDPAPSDAATVGPPTLRARGLTIGWTPEAPRVRDLDLEIGPGTRLAVLGPSGHGKTTLLLTLAGLLAPIGGRVELDGRDIATLPDDVVRRRAVMFAEDAHVFATSVRENLRVARGDATDDELHAALAATGLDAWVDSLPGGLDHLLGPDGTTVSGGERRRLLIARALVRRAPITLLDEPTEHLDPVHAAALLDGLLTTGPGAVLDPEGAVVVVTHDREHLPAGTTVLDLTATA